MKKALMVSVVASTIDQFCIPNIKLLRDMGYDVTVACNFIKCGNCTDREVRALKSKLDVLGVHYEQIDSERSISRIKQNIKAYKQLKNIIDKEKIDLVHCHTPIGAVIARLAAKGLFGRKENAPKVFYTAHGFHFYKGAPPKNWLVYYPVERILAPRTDILVTINREDYELASKKMKAGKVAYIPGVGIDIEKIQNSAISQEEIAMIRKDLGLQDGEKMLLSVGELNDNKNHITVINALKELSNKNWKYFICGKGPLSETLQEEINRAGLEEKVRLMGFVDVMKLYRCADLFVFPSYREGLSVALMEAIASELSVICSDIRGNRDLIDSDSRFLPDDIDKLSSMIDEFISKANDSESAERWKKIKENNLRNLQKCEISHVLKMNRELYESLG